MKLSDFDYDLLRELIAQEPAQERDLARLFYHDAPRKETQHLRIRDFVDLLKPGDLVVVNDTRVRRARLFVRRASGGRVELFLLGHEPGDHAVWRALANPARKLKVGEHLEIESSAGEPEAVFFLEPLERLANDADSTKPGPMWRLAFRHSQAAQLAQLPDIEALIERAGHVPLPPYISRQQGRDGADRSQAAQDAERYQTVFAARPGAVAAPTAGLHLTPEILKSLTQKGVDLACVTLHVGLGTFAPVEVEDIRDHKMHSEEYELTREAADKLGACRKRGGRIVAVGTTSVRVLESATDEAGRIEPGRGSTDIFITPGYRFRSVDLLLTNFHLPKSTLLMLVCAFIGSERCFALYREAIEARYRFFSFGDAMLLVQGECGGDGRRGCGGFLCAEDRA